MKKDKNTFIKSFNLVLEIAGIAIILPAIFISVALVILIGTLREHGNIPTGGIIFVTFLMSLAFLFLAVSIIRFIVMRKHCLGKITFLKEGVEWTYRKKRIKYFAWEDIVDWDWRGHVVREKAINLISKDNDSFRFGINKRVRNLIIELCCNDKLIDWLKENKEKDFCNQTKSS